MKKVTLTIFDAILFLLCVNGSAIEKNAVTGGIIKR